MKIDEDIAEIDNKGDLHIILSDPKLRFISYWLNGSDATFMYKEISGKRHPGTGTWFVKSSIFTAWLTEENSFLWLNGLAGTGKSFLSSTVIDCAFQQRRLNPQIGVAFFYFDFSFGAGQDESTMLLTLLVHLSEQLQDGYPDLTRLRDSYQTSIPPSSVLTNCLQRLIQRFEHVYIVLDALDESPRLGARVRVLETIEVVQRFDGDYIVVDALDEGPRIGARVRVLETIEVMQKWSLPGLHLLVTSRDEPDIRNFFEVSLDQEKKQEVQMKNPEIDKDIIDFISWTIHEHRVISKWSTFSDQIHEGLAKRAHDVDNFRWVVECLFRALRYSPRSVNYLDCLLNSLPQPQDEKYKQIVSNREIRTSR